MRPPEILSVREPIGEIECPWCGRDAELHQSSERTKLDPEGAGEGKPAYPKKYFVICPPVKGYRGCGTTLANGAAAQERILEKGYIFGATPRKKPKPAAPPPEPTPEVTPPTPTPAAVPATAAQKSNGSSNLFKLW